MPDAPPPTVNDSLTVHQEAMAELPVVAWFDADNMAPRAPLADHTAASQVIADLRADIEELHGLRERLSDLLKRTAVALKGPHEPLSQHSWHDLPEVAANLSDRLDVAIELGATYSARLEFAERECERLREFYEADTALARVYDEVSPGLSSVPAGHSERVGEAIRRRSEAIAALASGSTGANECKS